MRRQRGVAEAGDHGAGEREGGQQRRGADEEVAPDQEQPPHQLEDRPRVAVGGAEDDDDERHPHPGLGDHCAPRRALDPPVEAVDEDHLEHEVDGVRRDHDHERRPQVGDAAQVALAAEREEGERKPEGSDPHVGDRVVGGVALDPQQPGDLRCEREHEDRDGESEAQREPERLRPESVRDPLLAGPGGAAHLCRRAVLEEVEDAEEPAERRRRDRERRQLRSAQMADDRRVDEQVERLGGERAQCRDGELEDLAVVLRAELHSG
jgi:hypothetical protein